jgi:hypothetical protein
MDPWNEGYYDGCEGYGPDENPFPANTPEADAWYDGWLAADVDEFDG